MHNHADIAQKGNAGLILPLLVGGAIFAADMYVPTGYGVWVLYLVPLSMSVRDFRRGVTYFLAAVFSVTSVLAVLLGPSALSPLGGLLTRTAELASLWLIAFLLERYKASADLRKLNEELIEARRLAENRARDAEERRRILDSVIREREAAEEAVRESEAALDAFFVNTPVAMIIYDQEFRVIRMNQKAVDVLGREIAMVQGKTVDEIFPPAVAAKIRSLLISVMETKRALPLTEYRGDFYGAGQSDQYWLAARFPVPLKGGKTGVGSIAIDISERMRAEKALRKSEKEFRALSENMPDIVTRFDRSLRRLYANPAGERDEEVIAVQSAAEGEHPAGPSAALWRHNLLRVFETKKEVSLELMLEKNGRRRYLMVRMVPEAAAGGEAETLLAIANDITPLKEAQNVLSGALEEVRRKAAEAEEGRGILEAIMEYIPEGLMIIDGTTERVRSVSRYIADFAGVTRERMKGITLDEYSEYLKISDADNKPLRREDLPAWRSLKLGQTVLSEEFHLSKKSGETVRAMINTVPIRDAEGRVIGAVASWRDITERKRIEDALRRSEYEVRTLVDNSPDLVFRVDRQMRYVYANLSYERLTGIPRDRFAGKTNEELGMSESLSAYWRESFRRVLSDGQDLSGEFSIKGMFGERHFLARLIPEFAKNGIVDMVLVIARDITERKKVEDRIRYVSFHDEITGLYNRAYFEEELRRIDTGRALPIGIIVGDVNYLKLSNDVFGHREGDMLLRAVAGALRGATRKNDIVARWGGDEFAVILPGTPVALAEEIIARIREIARECGGTIICPSIALGVAAKEHKDQNIYQVIRKAEEAMYRDKIERSRENGENVLASLIERVRERLPDFDGHVARAADLALRFAGKLKLEKDQADSLRLLSRMHDLGLSAIPAQILAKEGKLEPREREWIKKRPEAGFRVVKSFPETAKISDEVLAQSERWDGAGGPRGLRGGDIPYLARVFALVESYEAMTSPRPYARTLSCDEAVEEVRRCAGSQFDPELAGQFAEMASLLCREPAAGGTK